ncbi:MAG: metallophosphoesterase [Calditrichaeota bacterium]|nr:MAG: metallophosphoesterase [Calditrichota bacterium]
MKILALSDMRGHTDYVNRVPELVKEVEPAMVVFTGNVLKSEARLAEWERAKQENRKPDYSKEAIRHEEDHDAQLYETLFDMLGQLNIPTAVIPGALDSPKGRYLRAVLHHESIFSTFHSVHGSFIIAPERSFVVAGFGGLLTERDNEDYFMFVSPRWEVEYYLKFLNELEQERILLFHTPPKDIEGLTDEKGSEIVNSLIKMYHPKFVFCGGSLDIQKKEVIGDSLVVLPGGLDRGNYALVDTRTNEVEFGNLR